MDRGLFFGLDHGLAQGMYGGLERGLAHGQFDGNDLLKTTIFTQSGEWFCPAGVFRAFVECWGGGGRGGSRQTVNLSNAGGAGGGAYAAAWVDVVPGTSYKIIVGAGGTTVLTGGTGQNGETSQWESGTQIKAVGGTGGSASLNITASGGLAANCVGDIKYSGGIGSAGISGDGSGAGGGGAGNITNGGDGASGAAPRLGGLGGLGSFNNSGGTGGLGRTQAAGGSGQAGFVRGGGGSGAARNQSDAFGGNGGRGEVRVSYKAYNEAQTKQSDFFTTAGAQTWVCPSGVTRILVECIGGGGGGGYRSSSIGVGGGGGGGAYARQFINVVPGTTYNLTVGAGGAGGIGASVTPATAGSDTFFDDGSKVLAKSGGAGQGQNEGLTAGPGGLASASIGLIKFSGGNGAIGNSGAGSQGGGGGGGAGSKQNGFAPTSPPGLIIGGLGGAIFGGQGGSTNPTNNGIATLAGQYGAGGAGARRASGAQNGGAGQTGLLIITY